jgi:hypothetical protein
MDSQLWAIEKSTKSQPLYGGLYGRCRAYGYESGLSDTYQFKASRMRKLPVCTWEHKIGS